MMHPPGEGGGAVNVALASPNPENKLFVGGAPPGTDENTLQQVRERAARAPHTADAHETFFSSELVLASVVRCFDGRVRACVGARGAWACVADLRRARRGRGGLRHARGLALGSGLRLCALHDRRGRSGGDPGARTSAMGGQGAEGGSNGARPLPPSRAASRRHALCGQTPTRHLCEHVGHARTDKLLAPVPARTLTRGRWSRWRVAGHPRQVHHAGLHRPPRRPLC